MQHVIQDLCSSGIENMPPELGAQSLKRWTISEGISCSVMSKQLHADSMDCIACQAPLSMEFSRQEYWIGLPFPSPGYLPDPGIEPRSSTLQADSLPSEPPGSYQQSLALICECITPISASVSHGISFCVFLCPNFSLLIKTPVIDLGPPSFSMTSL